MLGMIHWEACDCQKLLRSSTWELRAPSTASCERQTVCSLKPISCLFIYYKWALWVYFIWPGTSLPSCFRVFCLVFFFLKSSVRFLQRQDFFRQQNTGFLFLFLFFAVVVCLFFAVTNIFCTHSSWWIEVTAVFKWIWLALSKPYSHSLLKFDFKQTAAIKQSDAQEMLYKLSNSYNL